MSEDVAGATVQLTMKAAETGAHLLEKSMDLIAKLLQILANKKAEKQAKSPVKSTDLTDVKPGAVSVKSMLKSCRANGDAVCSSEQGLTKEDVKFITKKAREYGIPVSFTGTKGKDNLYANVRKSDAEIFKNICTEMMKNKIEERPQELGNFKVQEWEITFITAELNQHDLSAMFGKTKDGFLTERFFIYDIKGGTLISSFDRVYETKGWDGATFLGFDEDAARTYFERIDLGKFEFIEYRFGEE
jgi:hypothetical protein